MRTAEPSSPVVAASDEPFDWRRFIKLLAIAAVVLFGVQRLVVSSGYGLALAMSPSMDTAVYWVTPSSGAPEVGDLVTFEVPPNGVWSGRVVKRVIAVEGDPIEIREGRAVVNGVDIGPVHSTTSKGASITPQRAEVVPPMHIFVAGTHERSFDSRYLEFGTVNWGRVEGRAKELF